MRNDRLVVTLIAVALIASGASARAATHAPAGGANQKPSLQGCLNAWLFNGIWRMRATGVEPIEDFGTKGLGVAVEVRNGTHQPLQIGQSGIDGQGAGIELVGADGTALNVDAGAYQTQLGYKSVVQAGTVKTILRFHFQNAADAATFKPVKLIVQFDRKNVHVPGVRYNTPNPSLRIDLTCGGHKTPEPAASP